MTPSFLERDILAQTARALGACRRPCDWTAITDRAAHRVRPSTLIVSPAAQALRSAWALGQLARFQPMTGLRFDPAGFHWARPVWAARPLRVEVRELTAGTLGGVRGAAITALSPEPQAGLGIMFLSAGWPPAALARLPHDPGIRALARRWRACFVLANHRCLRLA